jgi:hypothetical protein
MLRVLVVALLFAACGSSTVMISVDGGVRAGGSAAGGSAGGTGSAGGRTAGGVAGAGGSAGGSVAAAGGSAGGSVSTAGGSAGGGASTAGGSAGGGVSTAGGPAGGGSATDGGVVALNGADQCDGTAPDVTAGGSFLGSTFTATDDYSVSGAGCPSMGSASGRDVAYLVAPATTRTYQVRVTPLDHVLADGGVIRFDPMLYVQQTTCGANACLAGTILNGVGDPEAVTFTVTGGQSAFIVVDGELASRGDFQLDVSF